MNCKQGDLAVVVRHPVSAPEILGAIVEVLGVSPAGRFTLPDGYVNAASSDASLRWVVRFARPIKAPLCGGGHRVTQYGAVPDAALRPIRGNDGEDETIQWAGKPEQVTA